MTASVGIAGVGLWMPGYPSAAAWFAGTADPTVEKPLGQALNRANRRRAGILGRALADVVTEAMQAAAVDPATIPTVVGSSIGEAKTMIGLLDEMWRHHAEMSPMKFSVSVHNTASGLISISNGNRGFTTSLAADDDTPAAALTEAVGLASTRDTPVAVACGDEAPPEDLVSDGQPWDSLAAAVVLVPAGLSCLARLQITHGTTPTVPGPTLPPRLARNPTIGLVDLVDAVLRRNFGTVALDRGLGRGFRAELTPGDDG